MESKKIIDAHKFKIIVLLILYFGINIALEFNVVRAFLLSHFSAGFLNKYINVILFGIFFFLIIIFFYKNLINALKDFKKNFKKNLKLIGKYILISYCLTFLCGIILTALNIGQSVNNEAIIVMYKEYGFLLVSTTCLIGPICEEVIFRGILLDFFKGQKESRAIFAIILSTLIFTLMHCHTYTLTDILSNLPVFAMGFTLGKLYTKSDNLICTTIQHMIINTISTIIIFTTMI